MVPYGVRWMYSFLGTSDGRTGLKNIGFSQQLASARDAIANSTTEAAVRPH